MSNDYVYNQLRNFDEVKFITTVAGINELKLSRSKTFRVRNNPWTIEFEKMYSTNKDNKLAYDSLAIFLRSKAKLSKNFTVVASLTVKLLSSKKPPHNDYIHALPFFSGKLRWGRHSFMSWNKLMHPNNGYVNNNECKFEIIIRASSLHDSTKTDLFNFEKTQLCCDDSPNGTFRLTIKNPVEMAAIPSPQFIVNNIPWRILIYRERSAENAALRIFLINVLCCMRTKVKCQASLVFKLKSFNPNVEDVILKTGCIEYTNSSFNRDLRLTSWTHLMDQQYQYVQNDSIVLEITVKIKKVIGLAKKRTARNEKLICIICFENLIEQTSASLSCGHVFCKDCIENSLENRAACPTCNQDASATELRTIYLPFR